MEEMLTLVTEEDEVLGPMARSRVHGNPQLIHRSVHVLILWEGQLLLQKRSRHKDTQPGKWDTSVGGHVSFGQSYMEAARREAEEELGLRLAHLDFLYSLRIRIPEESENIHTYLAHSGGPFYPQAEEIDAIRFWTRREIEQAMVTGMFTPHFEAEFTRFLACPQASLLK